jgi:hypothetical protein
MQQQHRTDPELPRGLAVVDAAAVRRVQVHNPEEPSLNLGSKYLWQAGNLLTYTLLASGDIFWLKHILQDAPTSFPENSFFFSFASCNLLNNESGRNKLEKCYRIGFFAEDLSGSPESCL